MKILVDVLPSWRGACPFAEEKQTDYTWTYVCKLQSEVCNLDEIENECLMFKVMEYTNEN